MQTQPSDNDAAWGSAVWAVAAAFGAYFCMYGFRKPFAVATYDEWSLLGIGLKPALVASQTAGYALSKFIGIKVISETPPHRRAIGVLLLVLLAEAALILFGLIPAPWNIACLFLNGLPLGMVFGLVLGFLEGRRLTEALTAGLCASFILADGVVKSVGAGLLQWGVSQFWMPAAAGLVFLGPLAFFVWMLTRVAPPTQLDVAHRSLRQTMNRQERWAMFRRYRFGLTLLLTIYLVITIVRSIRSDFATEIWRGLGAPAAPSTFTTSEMWVSLGVTIVTGAVAWIVSNRRAFFAALLICAAGFSLLIGALTAWRFEAISPFAFMVVAGLGVYLPYVVMHTTIFERLLAMTRDVGTIGFLMYLADAVGYLGFVSVMLFSGRVNVVGKEATLYLGVCWTATIISIVCLIGAWIYFANLQLGADEPLTGVRDATVLAEGASS